jgi:hypothetical protein
MLGDLGIGRKAPLGGLPAFWLSYGLAIAWLWLGYGLARVWLGLGCYYYIYVRTGAFPLEQLFGARA